MLKVVNLPEVIQAVEDLKKRYSPKTNPSAIVGYTANYALWIHEGTGPAVGRPSFRPPVEAFRLWAKRVLGDESLAFVVARSVGRKGLKPRKFLEEPARELAMTLGKIIATVTTRTRSLPKGLLVAALRLQRESQERVPVNTGNLKSTAFSRMERG